MDVDDASTSPLPSPSSLGPSGAPSKRSRPAAAKTFQCRGHGDCRMVFSRSEHLARHIRKHTGERPFSCHCSKQFSRLDNLRQHAQTVHAEKAVENDKMMKDLTSLHATMSAAARGQRAKRSAAPAALDAQPDDTDGLPAAAPADPRDVKQEELHFPLHQYARQRQHYDNHGYYHLRPGTSTGYEGADHHLPSLYSGGAHGQSWHQPQQEHGQAAHSFRPFSQSFRAQPGSISPPTPTDALPAGAFPPPSGGPQSYFHGQPPRERRTAHDVHHSFQPGLNPFLFGLPDQLSLPPGLAPAPVAPERSRPPTAGGGPRTLPPLAAVVAGPLAASPPSLGRGLPPPSSSALAAAQSGDRVLPLPTPSHRPATAGRPGTAPAAYYGGPPPSRPAFDGPHGAFGRPGLVARGAELPPLPALAGPRASDHHGGGVGAGPVPGLASGLGAFAWDAGDRADDDPFSFRPPPLAAELAPANPRKRPLPGGDDGVDGRARPGTRGERGPAVDLDYGVDSRPASRRLSVMELCNDPEPSALLPQSLGGVRALQPVQYGPGPVRDGSPASPALAGVYLPGGGGSGGLSRPVTSSGIVLGASALAIRDDEHRPDFGLLGGAGRAAAAPAAGSPGAAARARYGLPAGAPPRPPAAGGHGAPPSPGARGQLPPAVRVPAPGAPGLPPARAPELSPSPEPDAWPSPASAPAAERGSRSPASPLPSPGAGWRARGRAHAHALAGDGRVPRSPPAWGVRAGDAELLRRRPAESAWDAPPLRGSVHAQSPVGHHAHAHPRAQSGSPALAGMSA